MRAVRGVGDRSVAAVVALLCAFAVMGYAPVSAAEPVGPPSPPAMGALGGAGPCGVGGYSIVSPASAAGWRLDERVFVPTGTGETPLASGRCDSSKRPTIFFSHGYGFGDPNAYHSLIEHWVSLGNIVVASDYNSAVLDLPVTFVQADQGNVAAAAYEARIDTARVGFYGHSFGGGMTPYLLQQAAARGWGTDALFGTSLDQAYTQWEGAGGPIEMPSTARVFVINSDDDRFADARNGIDVFDSLTLPADRKAYIMLHSDDHGVPAVDASHLAPIDLFGVGAVSYTLWRLSDILETCSLDTRRCDHDLSFAGTWSDGVPIKASDVSESPVDAGPTPVILAECTGPIAQLWNPRIAQCGPTHS